MEIRNEALCTLGKTGRIGLQIVRLSVDDFISPVLLSPQMQKSTKIPCGGNRPSQLAAIFCKTCAHPSPKSHIG